MKKIVFVLVLALTGLVSNAQVTKVLTSVNEAGDVGTFELDCNKGFPTLAKGLKYNIMRHEFKGAELKNIYRIMLVMDGFYTTALNETMTISAVYVDGTKISEIKTIENDGYFDGACTLKLNSPPTLGLTTLIKQVIINAGGKEVVYDISEKKATEIRKNLQNIVNTK
jgi:hypothetical protein